MRFLYPLAAEHFTCWSELGQTTWWFELTVWPSDWYLWTVASKNVCCECAAIACVQSRLIHSIWAPVCMSGVSLASGLFIKFSASLELVGQSYMRLTSLSDPSAKQFSCACSLTFSIISFNFDSLNRPLNNLVRSRRELSSLTKELGSLGVLGLSHSNTWILHSVPWGNQARILMWVPLSMLNFLFLRYWKLVNISHFLFCFFFSNVTLFKF